MQAHIQYAKNMKQGNDTPTHAPIRLARLFDTGVDCLLSETQNPKRNV